jgi:tetratricopeptide (TPR) repeat protein
MPAFPSWLLRLAGLVALVGALAAARAQELSAVAGGSAGGNPFKAPAAKVYSIYDYRVLGNVTDSIQEFIELNEDLPGSVTPAALTADAARRNLGALLAGDKNRAFLKAVADAPGLQTGEGLNAAAMVFFAQGRSAEALACLVKAADKAPADPAALLNLAAAALVYRQANEGLALVVAAEKAGELPAGGYGLSGAHLAGYLRGYALMLRGDYQAAQPLLAKVVAAEPNLKEAALALALVEAKLGEDPRKSFLLGVWRQRGKLVVTDHDAGGEKETESPREPDPFTEGESIAPSMADLFDLSSASPGRLNKVERPTTPEELMAMLEPYSEEFAASMGEAARQHNEIAGPAFEAFQASGAPPAYARRMIALYNRATLRIGAIPELDAAARESDRLRRQLDEMTESEVESARAIQEPIHRHHAELNNRPGHPSITPAILRQQAAELNASTQQALERTSRLLTAYHHALEREFVLRSSYMYGMLGHIGAPSLRTALLAEAESVRHEMQALQLSAVINLSTAIGAPVDGSEGKVEAGEAGHGPGCTDDNAKYSVSVDLEVVGVELSCNSVSLEISAPVVPPFIDVSAEVGLDTSGVVTVFAGPKVSPGLKGAAKGGVYLSADKEGFRDFGVKGEVKMAAGMGPVTVNQKMGESVISFVPGPDPGPAPGPLPAFAGGAR